MKVSKRKLITFAIVLIATLSISTLAYAAITPARTADNGTTNTSQNRGLVATDDSDIFVAIGGGTAAGSCATLCTDAVSQYTVSTDTWSSLDTLSGNQYLNQQVYGSDGNWIVIAGQAPTCCSWEIYNIAVDAWATFSGPAVNSGIACGSLGGSCVGTVANNGRLYVFSKNALPGSSAGVCSGADINEGWIAHVFAQDIATNLSSPPYVCGTYSELTSLDLSTSRIAFDDDAIYFTASDGGTQTLFRYDLVSGTISDLGTTPGGNIAAISFSTDNGAFFGFPNIAGDFQDIEIYQIVSNDFAFAQTITDAQYAYINPPDGNCTTQRGFSSAAITLDNGETRLMFGSAVGCQTNLAAPTYNRWWIGDGTLGIDFSIPNSIDTWIPNALDLLGLNSDFGRLIVGSLVVISIFVLLTIRGVPWVISMGIAGMSGTFLTAAMILDASVLLGMIGIVGMGVIVLFMALFSGGQRHG